MTFSEAKDFLTQLSKNWNQEATSVRNFIEWQKTASVEELEELDQWHREYLSSMRGQLAFDDELVEKNSQWLMQNMHDTLNKQHLLKIAYRRRNIFFKIAAVLLIALGISASFIYVKKANNKPSEILAKAKVIAPGGDKAVLTLADGRQIELDSVGKADVVLQDGAKVLKLGKGILAYKSSASAKVTYNTLTTPKGGQYQVVLPDGSKVWLNSASSLKFPTAFVGNERKVELKGEGYFEIVHNAAKPFFVKAETVNVKVLGTGFNIMAYSDEKTIKTTLVHGSVEVNSGIITQHIVPGEQASIAKGEVEFDILHPNIQEIIAWKNGEFWFNNTSIQSIMRQIARWYNVDIAYKGNLSDVKLSGVLSKKQNVEALFNILEATKQVRFKEDQNIITVTPYSGS